MRAALLAFALMATPALAQRGPLTLPTRDVTIVYAADGQARDAIPGGIPGTVRVAWNAGRRALRVQPEGRNQALLLDLDPPSLKLVDAGLHSAMDLPVRARDLDPIKLQDAKLVRRGPAVVAGLPCTDYDVASRRGRGTVCLTDDGVALRAVGDVDGRHGSFTALSVAYAPLPPAMFDVPRDYMRLAIPGLNRF